MSENKNIDYIFNKFECVSTFLDPFPHFIIDEFLNPKDFNKVLNELNHWISQDKSLLETASFSRKIISLENLNKESILFNIKATLHNEKIINVFKKKFMKFHENKSIEFKLKTNIPEVVYNPNLHKPLTPRNAHFDPWDSFGTWLYYIRDDAKEVTKLNLYKYKNGFQGYDYSSNDQMIVPKETIELHKSIETKPNRFVGFLVNENAVHSVSERQANSGIRVYMTSDIRSNVDIYFPFKKLSNYNKLRFFILRPLQKVRIFLKKYF